MATLIIDEKSHGKQINNEGLSKWKLRVKGLNHGGNKARKGLALQSKLSLSIGEQTSPLFDVISKEQRDALYQNPYNSIHLSVPLHSETPEAARKTLNSWKENGAIVQDKLPGIYVYYQYFSLQGSSKEYIRKGFISWIKLAIGTNPTRTS